MARSVSIRESAPFSAINMTPFIDILLVLLIMLIITVPISTHKLAIDLPAPSDKPVKLIPPQVLALDAAGVLYWNGQRIPDERLPGLARSCSRPGRVLTEVDRRPCPRNHPSGSAPAARS